MTPHILVAEDSPTQAEQLRFLLEEHDYQVTVARDGRKALDIARQVAPTVVISDVVMPELDGYGLCREIKADDNLKGTPVILVTSLSSSHDVIRGLECGADYFLRKPFEERYLLSRLQYIVSNWVLRADNKMRPGIEIVVGGKRYFINSERQQILDLLMSTYEEAIRINEELGAANKQLELRNREIERATKFKDKFLTMMSHEVRTPLTSILGNAEMLANGYYGELTAEQQKAIGSITVAGKHLSRLTEDILDFSRIEAGQILLEPEWFSMNELLNEIQTTLNALAAKNHQELTATSTADVRVRADKTRLRQVMMNLAGNAIKYAGEGQRIDLRATARANDVRVEVRDSGPGIPVAEQSRIFDAFVRGKGVRAEGTGLGLSIAQRIVELHGGTLGLESAPGHGSCFYFVLPAAAAVSA